LPTDHEANVAATAYGTDQALPADDILGFDLLKSGESDAFGRRRRLRFLKI